MSHIKTLEELRECPAGMTTKQWFEAVREARNAHFDAADKIRKTADIRRTQLSADDQRAIEAHLDHVEQLGKFMEESRDFNAVDFGQVIQEKVPANLRMDGQAGSAEYRDGFALSGQQSFLGHAQAKRANFEDFQGAGEELDINAYFRGMFTGRWDRGAQAEKRAMVEGTNSAGGYAVPTLLASQVIDMARAQTQVLKAGARVFPMANRTVDVAKQVGDPSPAWHTEAASISPSDLTLSKVTLNAQVLAAQVLASRELIQDAPNVGDMVLSALAKTFALKLDYAALYGSGTAPEPRGLINQSGITLQSSGTNGASFANWDGFVDAVGTLEAGNEHASGGIIVNPRTAKSAAKLKDTTNQPLARPSYLDGLPFLTTTQVPVNKTVGTSSDCSDAFLGDWSQLLVGVRAELDIQLLKERYSDQGLYGWVAWFRADIAVARPGAFVVVNGIRP